VFPSKAVVVVLLVKQKLSTRVFVHVKGGRKPVDEIDPSSSINSAHMYMQTSSDVKIMLMLIFKQIF